MKHRCGQVQCAIYHQLFCLFVPQFSGNALQMLQYNGFNFESNTLAYIKRRVVIIEFTLRLTRIKLSK